MSSFGSKPPVYLAFGSPSSAWGNLSGDAFKLGYFVSIREPGCRRIAEDQYHPYKNISLA
jgi:hypothetical protein